jgi:hypothetical protein
LVRVLCVGKNQPPFYCEDVQLMYDKIMTEKLNPKKIDEVAINLLQQVRPPNILPFRIYCYIY